MLDSALLMENLKASWTTEPSMTTTGPLDDLAATEAI
jgi:hypothetical protein